MLWFFKVGLGICGMEATHLIEAENETKALEIARDLAIENAESYGYYQDEERFGDLDQVVKVSEDEDGEDYDPEYDEEGTLEYHIEPYNAELHYDLL